MKSIESLVSDQLTEADIKDWLDQNIGKDEYQPKQSQIDPGEPPICKVHGANLLQGILKQFGSFAVSYADRKVLNMG